MFKKIGDVLKSVGPGFIIAAVVLGPGSITVSSQIGSAYGYRFLWVLLLAAIFMATYASMSTRFGVVSQSSILQVITRKYGRWFSVILGIAAFLSCLSFQFGNNLGIGIGMQGITGIDNHIWPLIFTFLALLLLFWTKNLYKILEKLMMILVMIMIVSFFLNLIITKPGLYDILRGFIPHAVQSDQLGSLAALMGTTFALAGAMYQSYLVQDKGWKTENLNNSLRDTYSGISLLALITGTIIVTSAASLYPLGIKISSAADMAVQLEALFGGYAKVIFSVGLCAAAFSSLMVNAVIGAGLLSDSLNMGRSMNQPIPKIFATIILLTGMIVAVFFRGNTVYALIMAQASSILAVPFIGVGLFLVLNNKEIMGTYRNSWWQNGISILGLLSMCLMVYFMYQSMIRFIGSI